jgi:uncharacterized protein
MTAPDETSVLLEIAIKAIENTVLKRGERGDVVSGQEALSRAHAGVFVTITVRGALRGCIGDLDPRQSLRDAIIHAAESACARDTRFAAIRPEDLEDMAIDITLLEPMETVEGEADIVVGEHGVFIEDGLHRGILLPQVAAERRWSSRRFLEALCEKAGLPDEAWKRGSATLKRFRARIISSPRTS